MFIELTWTYITNPALPQTRKQLNRGALCPDNRGEILHLASFLRPPQHLTDDQQEYNHSKMTCDGSSNGVVQATRPPAPLSAAIHVPLCKEMLFKAQEQKGNKSSALSTLSLKWLIIFNWDSLFFKAILWMPICVQLASVNQCLIHSGYSFRPYSCRQGTYAVSG